MNKFTLVYDTLGTIHSNLELPLYLEYFNVDLYDPNTNYNPTTTLYYTVCGRKTSIHDKFLQQGFRIVYDNLHEPGSNFKSNHGYVMHNQNYMWYHDSLQMIDYNYHTYCPNKTYKKLALMPMRLRKPHRTMLLEKVVAYLDDFYWSYRELGRCLPNDMLTEDWSHQRYFNPEWYNDTFFSLVAETRISKKPNEMLLISEKTFKPIAFYHPFLIWGEAGTLQHLKKLGFETFDNLFDESYDTISDLQQRLNVIVKNISNFKKYPYDQTTLEKLQHNHARFFDRNLVEQQIQTEIIQPLLAYAEATQ
jgi:hypothetical protein